MQLISAEGADYYCSHLTCFEGELGRVVLTDNMVPDSLDGTIALDYLGTERELIVADGTHPLVVSRA